MEDWLLMNLSKNIGRQLGTHWDTFFSQICWMLWLNQNKLVFEGKTKPFHAIGFKASTVIQEVFHAKQVVGQATTRNKRMEMLIG